MLFSSPVGWNPTAAAAAWSTLAGVVAVGALTAITLILTLPVEESTRGSHSLPLLLIAFPALLVASLDFATIAGLVRHFRHFLTHRRGRFAQGEPDEVLGALADVAGRAMGHDLSNRAAYP